MKGKKAFEYLLSIKYFNNPTNNVDYELPPKPEIIEDEKASANITNNLEIVKEKPMTKEEARKILLAKMRKR
jgi:hypothetical protein